MSAPDGLDPGNQRQRVIRSLDGAARTYFTLAALAGAAGCGRLADNFVESAARLIACLHQILEGDAQLESTLAAAIDDLSEEPSSNGSWYLGQAAC